jgi:MFS family permease
MSTNEIAAGQAADTMPWYRELGRAQWNALIGSNLGWLFDGFENYALILTAGPALRQLLNQEQQADLPLYVGAVLSINLLGWAIGGLAGGIFADYFGRKRTMMYAILFYSIATGLSALAVSWWSFAALRFLVGLAVGSEWATGSSIMAELWPGRARGKGAGLMQCGFGIGFFLAALVWLVVAPIGPDAWRFMYLLGVVPALFTLWIRRSISESALWDAVNAKRKAARASKRGGTQLTTVERDLTKFTLSALLTDRATRKTTLIVSIMSLATTVGFWSISTWVPQYIGSIASAQGFAAARWASFAGMAYTAGSITGYIAFGFLADTLGRKPVTLLFFLLTLVLTPVLFFGSKELQTLLLLAYANAIFSNGQYSWMPVWLPELYPTRMRATALAFVFNAPRFIAFIGPLIAGKLILIFQGFGWAAVALSLIYVPAILLTPFLCETRGKSLPE